MPRRPTRPLPVSPTRYLSAAEAARYLNMSQRWVQSMSNRDLMPYILIPAPTGAGFLRRYDASTLDAWMRSLMRNPPVAPPEPNGKEAA